MTTAALVILFIACAGIIAVGARFLLAPRAGMAGYGIAQDSPHALRALTEIKGIRDIASGVVLLVVWAGADHTTLGWAMVAAALTPTADAMIVRRNGGQLPTALGIHGLTAALLLAAGLVLALS
jgi:hypothetical protein